MLLDFFKRRSRSRKQANDILGKPSQLVNESVNAPQIKAQEFSSEDTSEDVRAGDVLEIKEKTVGAISINSTNHQAVPAWTRGWLRKNDPDISDSITSDKSTLTTNSNPENLNASSKSAIAEDPELPIVDLVEPRNVEVREMILRQIQNSRSVARYMCSTENLVEEQIRKSMERGEFNNLQGKGKPLKFEENPYENPELRLPFKILKDAGFAPYWIEMSKQIDAEIAACQMIFEKFLDNLAFRKARYGYIKRTPEFELRLRDVLKTCSEKFDEINKKIDKYNMIVPMYWLQRKKIDTEIEMANFRRRLDDQLWGRSH